jgi:pimeloyl-ACP methyl ester carboxylesterase
MAVGPFRTVLAEQLARGVSASHRLPNDVVARYCEPFGSLSARLRFLAFLRALDPVAAEKALASYGGMPVRIVWGEHDVFQPVAEAHALARALPSAHLRVVPGGHFLPEERPEVLAREILAALHQPIPTAEDNER